MKNLLVILTIVMLFVFPSSIYAEEIVTVRLHKEINDTSELELRLKGGYLSIDSFIPLKEGVNYKLLVKRGHLYLKEGDQVQKLNGPIHLIPDQYDTEHQIFINNQPYLGAMEFQIENQQFIRPINQLPLEDYLKGVVPLEVYPSWNLETLKAQALAARTYAVAHLYDKMDDTIRYQVYGGYDWKDSTTRAVEETKGEVITYNHQLINAFYSASNGGMTESNANVWGGKAVSYFPIKRDEFDPVLPWEYKFHQEQINLDTVDWNNPDWWEELQERDQKIASTIKNKLQKNGYPGDIKIVSIPKFELSNEQYKSKRSSKGSITIEFLHRLFDGTVLFEQLNLEDVNLNKIRPMIGGDLFKSYYIDSLESNDGLYTMKGRGNGHGVGMSQWGANYMGEKGKTYSEIIQFYFPGTSIETITDTKEGKE
jgi:SpoIID/LytB domain protein